MQGEKDGGKRVERKKETEKDTENERVKSLKYSQLESVKIKSQVNTVSLKI